jgi:beta-1,2-mannobiose phosphorylase / 1,2-beta-oligomannan phosphorylase
MEQLSAIETSQRFLQNPIIAPKDLKPSAKGLEVKAVLSPSVFRYNKKTWLLIQVVEGFSQSGSVVSVPILDELGEIKRIQFPKDDPLFECSDDRTITYNGTRQSLTLSHLRILCSDDGKEFYESEDYLPIFGKGPLEEWGIEDCCVVEISGIFSITYRMLSTRGAGVGLIQTRDWRRFDPKGMIFSSNNRGCSIFEEKIRDKYYALHHPYHSTQQASGIWVAESPDGFHWGNHRCLATARKSMWDAVRVRAGGVPINTPQGWLVIYQGTDHDNRVSIGAMLLDIKNPCLVIGRCDSSFFEAQEPYELSGDATPKIVSNGHLVIGDKLQLYYSASDRVICGATFSIKQILSLLTPEKISLQ